MLLVPGISALLDNRVIKLQGVGKQRQINIGFTLSVTIMFFFRAFRAYTVGGDLYYYRLLFNFMGNYSWDSLLTVNNGYEAGFLYYNKIIYTLFHDFQALLICTAIINVISILLFIKNNSRIPWLSLFLYIAMTFWPESFNIERQAIAFSFLLIGFSNIKNRRFFRYLFWVLLATSFHVSSIIWVVLYFVYNLKLDRKYWIAVIGGGIVVYIFAGSILRTAISFLYANNGKYSTIVSTGAGRGYLLYLIGVLLIQMIIFYRYQDNDNKDTNLFIHMLVIAVLLQLLSLQLPFVVRAVRLFSISIIFLIPEDISMLRGKESKLLAEAAMIIIFGAWFVSFISAGVNNSQGVVPYITMWGL